MSNRSSKLEFTRDYGLRIALLVSVLVVFAVTSPGFRSVGSVYSLVSLQLPLIGIVAMGLAFTMIAGELDLSVASMATLCGVVAILAGPAGLVPAILAGTLAGVLIGALQGFAIARLGINSLVFTTGTLILLRGVAYILSGNGPIVLDDLLLGSPLTQRWGPILSAPGLIAIVVIAVLGVFLALTRPGRNIYAIGGSRAEATAAGVPVRNSLTLSFAVSGGCAGLVGALSCLKGGSATPEGFHDLLLVAIAAALIGGIGLYGGVGDVWHVLLGVGIVGALSVGMTTVVAPNYISNLVLGAFMLLLLLLDWILDRAATRERLARMRKRLEEGSTSSPAGPFAGTMAR
jgi:ribose transport system permease protein